MRNTAEHGVPTSLRLFQAVCGYCGTKISYIYIENFSGTGEEKKYKNI